MKRALTFFILLFSICVSSQTLNSSYYLLEGLDSSNINPSDLEVLKTGFKSYHQTKSDTAKIQILSRIVEMCFDEKIWTRYNRLMYNISIEKKQLTSGDEQMVYKASEALALNNFGYYFFNYSTHIDSALFYYEKAKDINEEIRSYGNLIVSYSNIANVYQNKGDFLKAIELYNKALSLEHLAKEKTGIISAMNNMSNIYMYLGDTATSLLYLKRCFMIANRSNDKHMKAHLLHNMGAILSRKNLSTGIQSIKTALSLRRQIGDKKGVTHSLLMLASLTKQQGDLASTNLYMNEAKGIINEIQNPNHVALYHRNLAELAMIDGRKKEVIENIDISIDQFKKTENINDLIETLVTAIKYCNQYPDLHQKKLEYIEQHYEYGLILNKNAAQKAAIQTKYENEIRMKDAEQKIKDEKNLNEKKKQRYFTIGISIILILSLIFSFFIFKALKTNREKTILINKQKHLVEEKQKEIIDSINYSKRIQNSFIPSEQEFNETFPNSFVIYDPKDIVSGDFYWIMDTKHYPSIKKKMKAIAVADCTGHGVPGAMLSMLGASILNQAILEQSVQSSADILNFLDSELKKNLRSKNNEIIRDGMDISCCLIDTETLKMQFAGANNPCWVLRNGEITELKADKQAVTAAIEDYLKPFSQKEFQLQKNDMLFLFTDGFADQFGGPKGKKFMYSRMEKLLINSYAMQANEQKEMLTKEFSDWKGSLDQVDDVCLIGIRI